MGLSCRCPAHLEHKGIRYPPVHLAAMALVYATAVLITLALDAPQLDESQLSAKARRSLRLGSGCYRGRPLVARQLSAQGSSQARGAQELISPEPAGHFVVGYIVLTVSFVLEGHLLPTVGPPGQPEAESMQRDLIEHILATSDPTLRAVFAEDSAALAGLLVAAAGLAAHQLTGSRFRTPRDRSSSACCLALSRSS